MKPRVILSCVVGCLFQTIPAIAAIDPYQSVVFITNTVAWPYDTTTLGTDSFQFGSAESGNEDALVLRSVYNKGFHFPKNFEFAVACSAYQYEGNRVAPSSQSPDGIGWSMWDVFSQPGSWLNPQGTTIAQVPPTSEYTTPSGQYAIQGFDPTYYAQDIQLEHTLGVKFVRISISWPRLFPHAGMQQPDPAGVAYYQHVFDALKQHHLVPLITLYHWDLPAWLYNFGDSTVAVDQKTYGWLDMSDAKDNVALKEFQKYVATSYQLFGKYTPYFSTFNEPLTFTVNGLVYGNHAPGHAGFELLSAKNPTLYGADKEENLQRLPYLQAINLIKAHYIAYKTMHDIYNHRPRHSQLQSPEVSIVLNSDWGEPYRIACTAPHKTCHYNTDDIQAAKRNMDFMLGWWLHPVMFGTWPRSMNAIYGTRITTVGLDKDASCLSEGGQPVDCQQKNTVPLTDYIRSGGALDLVALNHYTGYFVVDPTYAKAHYGTSASTEATVPPNEYGGSPLGYAPGWDTDQSAYVTQFRYFKRGDVGRSPGASNAYVIGNAGNYPWMRQTWFVYRKLLQYINFYYLHDTDQTHPKATKLGVPFSTLGIYLTENGTSLFHESQNNNAQSVDTARMQYLLGNLGAVQHSILDDHINVQLYTYWSIADNFEWAEGYDSRFGLVWIDYDNQWKREPKPSFYCYQRIVQRQSTANILAACQ